MHADITGAAPYFVTLAFQRREAPAVVTDALTGKKLGIVRPPVSGTRFTSRRDVTSFSQTFGGGQGACQKNSS
jgi:hypothetical protein